jgi:hypothetical protein
MDAVPAFVVTDEVKFPLVGSLASMRCRTSPDT